MLLFTSNNVTLLVSLQQVFKTTTFTLDTQSAPFQCAYRNGNSTSEGVHG